MATNNERQIKEPGPEHPITIEPTAGRVRVTVGDAVVADSERALTLCERGYEPVYYFPTEEVDFSLLEPTEHTTYCPYKGLAGYYSIPAGGERSLNAAWQYRDGFVHLYLLLKPQAKVDSRGCGESGLLHDAG